MLTKAFRGSIELKADGQEGSFRAVFATFNVVDLDGDVTLPGAFTEGQSVRIASWGHKWGELPVGIGTIHADATKAWVDGQFFLDTSHGLDTYKTVKGLADLQEWSYGYDILGATQGQFSGRDVQFLKQLDVHEVSPVLLGAGVGTGTESIKSRGLEAKAYGAPDGSYEELSSELGFAFSAQQIPVGQDGYAYVVGTFSDHFIGCVWRDDTEPTYWDVPYVRSADGAVTLGSAVEVEALTEFVPVKGFGLPYDSHGGRVALSVQEFVKRSASGSDARLKEGRAISEARRQRMGGVRDALRSGADEIDAMLTETAPTAKTAAQDATESLRLRTETQRLFARLHFQPQGVPA